MSETGVIEIAGIVVTIIIFLIGLYLAAKDNAQQRVIDQQQTAITDLYAKHTSDVEKLAELRLLLSEQHYKKDEIAGMFTRFKEYFDEKFKELRSSIDAIDDRRHNS